MGMCLSLCCPVTQERVGKGMDLGSFGLSSYLASAGAYLELGEGCLQKTSGEPPSASLTGSSPEPSKPSACRGVVPG